MRGLHPKQVNLPHNWYVEDTKSYTNFPELARDMPQVWTCKFNSEHEWSKQLVTKSPTALLRNECHGALRSLDDTRGNRGTFVPWRVPVENKTRQDKTVVTVYLAEDKNLLFYNDLDLNNQKILCLTSIYQFERTGTNLNHPRAKGR